MKTIVNKWIPVKGFSAINLFGIFFVRPEAKITKRLLNHESIHTEQIKETGYIGFYILYVLEWLYRLVCGVIFGYDKKTFRTIWDAAYKSISFEVEAYGNQTNYSYLNTRKRYAWTRFLS